MIPDRHCTTCGLAWPESAWFCATCGTRLPEPESRSAHMTQPEPEGLVDTVRLPPRSAMTRGQASAPALAPALPTNDPARPARALLDLAKGFTPNRPLGGSGRVRIRARPTAAEVAEARKAAAAARRDTKAAAPSAGEPAPSPPVGTGPWYYVQGQQAAGPVDESTLRGLLRDGTIMPDVLVWSPDLPNWASARTIGLVVDVPRHVVEVQAAPRAELPRAASESTCHHCGEPASPDTRFCGTCGHNLSASSGDPGGASRPMASCPRCGDVAVPGARFCGGCGGALP